MEWWQSLILGLVEGITEYLPVSSTGHLLLTQRALGIPESDAANAFAICIQAGAIVAVLGLYRTRVVEMARGLLGNNPAGRNLALALVAAFLPAAIIGFLADKWVHENLFGGERWGLWPVVVAWFVGGVAILAVAASRRRRVPGSGLRLENLTLGMALGIGLWQCVAMWPGVSRSLVTIVGGVLAGLALPTAVEFSFLLGVLTLGAATCYDALRHGREMLGHYGAVPLLLGFLAAWASAVVAVRWMVGYLNRRGMGIFGWYRIALACVVALLLWNGFLHPAPL